MQPKMSHLPNNNVSLLVESDIALRKYVFHRNYPDYFDTDVRHRSRDTPGFVNGRFIVLSLDEDEDDVGLLTHIILPEHGNRARSFQLL